MMKNIKDILDKNAIYKIYFFAIVVYLLPLISLGVFVLDQFMGNKTEMLFFVIFLMAMSPSGLLGMILSAVGLVTAIKKQNGLNKLIGIIGLIGGLIFLGGGIFGLMLIYVVVGG